MVNRNVNCETSPYEQGHRLLHQLTSIVSEGIVLLFGRLQRKDAESHYRAALTLLQAGDLDQAQDFLQITIDQQPDHIPSYQALGEILILQKKWQQCLELHSTIQPLSSELAQELAQKMINCCELLLEGKQWHEALICLNHINSLNGLTVDQQLQLHYLEGRLHEHQKNWRSALHSFREVLRLDPDHIEANHHSGTCREAIGEYVLAIRCYEKALLGDFQQPRIHFDLGKVYFRTGELSQAIGSFNTATRLDPGVDTECYAYLGLALIQSGNLSDAGVALTKSLGRDIDCLRAHYGMALMLIEDGNFEEARARFTFILSRDRHFWAAKAGIGLTYLADKHTKESGRKFLRSPQIERARNCFEDVLEHDQNIAEAHFGLGEVHRLNRDLRQAIRSYEKALEINGSLTMAYFKLGKAFAASMMIEEAVQSVTAAWKMNPHNHEIHTFLCRLQDKQDTMLHYTGVSYLKETQIQ